MWRSVLRFFCLFSLSLWMGGFTFYSAVVIPVLHESLGRLDTGSITQRVTDYLNGLGSVALGLWWLSAYAERTGWSGRMRRTRLVLLTGTTLLLLTLIALHRIMDGRLEMGKLRDFYPLHRSYLVASTAQWFANLGLMVLITRREATE